MFPMLFAVAACGGPALQNVPHPNNTAMAAGFAAAAAGATLASPADAQKKAEAQSKGQPADKKPKNVKETVPGDVLDRLDHPPPDDGKPKAQPLPPAQDPKTDPDDETAPQP